jgi:hypothetical protein
MRKLTRIWGEAKHFKWLVLAGILMYLLFIASPMKLNRENTDKSRQLVKNKISQLASGYCEPGLSYQSDKQSNMKNSERKNNAISDNSCQALLKGLELQLVKANTEIQSRLIQETEWFKIKYLYVGVLLLGFLINTYFKGDSISPEDVNKRFMMASDSYVTSFILSCATIVAISIDMQIRSGRIVINQLGSWIYYYVEPILFGADELGWEGFLRLDGGYHANAIYNMTFWPNVYYLSIGLYILYLVVTRRALAKEDLHHTTWLGFWMLHSTLLIAALSSHVIPFIFSVNPHPIIAIFFPKLYIFPLWMVPITGLSWASLLLVAYVYVEPPKKS